MINIKYPDHYNYEYIDDQNQSSNLVLLDITTNISSLSEENITNKKSIIETNLKVSDTFKTWDIVDNTVNAYTKCNEFVPIKTCKDLDSINKSIVRRRVYSCWKAGINNPKKQVSFYFQKNATEIHITKFNNTHNHKYDLATIELAPKNSRIPQMILDKIEHYTVNSCLGAGQQYDFLIKEFPQYNIKKKGLYNAIQKFRGVRIHDESDASTMLLYFMKLHEEDNDYIVISSSGSRNIVKELVKVIENELEKEAQYSQIRNYYRSNLSTGLSSTYDTIFKDIDSVLKDYLAPTPFFIHTHWFEFVLVETTDYITISQRIKIYITKLLHYIDQMRTANSYMPTIRENVSKKVKFGTMILVAKTCVQVAMEENVISELTGLLMEFIMKYCRSTGLNIEKVYSLGNEIQEPLSILNPEYHKPRSRSPNRLKSLTEENSVQQVSSSSKTCSYCLEKGHNIRGCKRYKLDLSEKENN
ncbi:20323_t:CDS:2 [Gigaspora margarita]|uniref:20323_t:CDS:1 n=1 Tax=Gigaspora margarita TaxID=4874 RepID=A0ABN7VBD0_GIGMA|nr:20323_t:CDS:2 [Gigaspora margarita]